VSDPAAAREQTGGDVAVARGGTRGFFTRYKRPIQVGVLALIAVFLGTAIAKSWSDLGHYSWHLRWGLLIAGFALLVAQELSYGFIWRAILARLGSHLDILSSQRIYLGAEFVRYIPGNVWHVITRVLWAEQKGVPKPIGFASMVIELATKITSAALVFAFSLFFWQDTSGLLSGVPRSAFIVAGGLLVPMLLLGLYPPLLQGLLNAGLRKVKRQPVQLPLRYGDVLLIALCWGLSWLVAGLGFYFVILALVSTPLPTMSVPLCIGIYALVWDIGFLSFVTPSGLGVREAATVILLTQARLVPAGAAGVGVATVVAIIARLLSTGAEVICITAAHAIRGGPPAPDAGALAAPSEPIELAQSGR
jgi:hypothetical protein